MILFFYSELNVYGATVPDRMHHCDLGLFNYQVKFAQDYIRLYCGQEGINEFDRRLAEIPRLPGLKSFRHGLGNITRFTAAEFRSMMKQLVFVIDGLIVAKHKPDLKSSQAKLYDKKLVVLFVSWNKMYIFSRKETFTDSELAKFQVIFIIKMHLLICYTKLNYYNNLDDDYRLGEKVYQLVYSSCRYWNEVSKVAQLVLSYN
jgi:hypothetical protein